LTFSCRGLGFGLEFHNPVPFLSFDTREERLDRVHDGSKDWPCRPKRLESSNRLLSRVLPSSSASLLCLVTRAPGNWDTCNLGLELHKQVPLRVRNAAAVKFLELQVA
jgi:hypothetical protein